ncbi:hypothetical protein RMATCC62417_05788 [Rhizopus microsporus]|nr:hypothetical protein RMATCC62417_05788 [Rhizopus microsporus]
MGKGSARKISLTSGVASDTCSAHLRYFLHCKKFRIYFKQHNVTLLERPSGIRRYNTPHFVYIKAGSIGNHPLNKEHSGCPSCIAHFKELKDLKEHVVNNHPQASSLQSRQKCDNDQLTQENSDNRCEMPSSKRPSEDDAESLFSMYLSFSPPDDNGRLLIHGFDATDAFYKLQQPLQTQK